MSPVTAAAAAAATQEITPSSPDPSGENRKSARFWKLFFPISFGLMAVWFVVILAQDKVEKHAFDPTGEFALDPLFGTYDGFFAINKGVVYLVIALLGSALFALYVNRTVVKRLRQESKTQTAIEGVYEFAYDAIAGMLPAGKLFNRYMPYVASIFIFVLLLNLTSFVPLPLNTHHTIGGSEFLYAFGVYAVTSNIFCTATLALLTFGIYHLEGVRAHGLGGYLKTWSAGQKGFAGAFVWVVEALTNLVLKPLSLAVRLFANMLSGHILILLMMALAGIIGGAIAVSVLAQTAGTAIALAFYLFEMVLVAGLQAYIFAVLSAIYISSAAEQHH